MKVVAETRGASIADALPPEVAALVHPDWRKNEAEYWAHRESLKAQYDGQWIAFANGTVIASGTNPVDVLHDADVETLHPYFILVGAENTATRMRLSTFAYDFSYPGQSLPVIEVEFRTKRGQTGVVFDRVIPDTGSDASSIPWSECKRIGLDPSSGVPSMVQGIGGSTSRTMSFVCWVFVDGNEHRCRLQADFNGDERILGRDVLNRLRILFDGPAGQVVLNP